MIPEIAMLTHSDEDFFCPFLRGKTLFDNRIARISPVNGVRAAFS